MNISEGHPFGRLKGRLSDCRPPSINSGQASAGPGQAPGLRPFAHPSFHQAAEVSNPHSTSLDTIRLIRGRSLST